MARKRFLFEDGNSHKFWEVETKGTDVTVRFGRVGTSGQSKTKSFPSTESANAYAAKQVDAKTAKGYRNDVRSGAASAPDPRPATTPTRSKAPSGRPTLVVAERDYDMVRSVHLHGRDVWFAEQDDIEAPWFERWRFRTPAHAKKATTFIATTIKRRAALSKANDPDIATWTQGLARKVNCIEAFEQHAKGPLHVQTGGIPRWISFRPPSRCVGCGAPMVFALSLRGKMGKLLAAGEGIYLLTCPSGEARECSEYSQVCFQRKKRDPYADRVLVQDESWVSFHLGRQVHISDKCRSEPSKPAGRVPSFAKRARARNTSQRGPRYSVAIHVASQGIPGDVSYADFTDLALAKKHVDAEAKRWSERGFEPGKPPRLTARDTAALDELWTVNRARPKLDAARESRWRPATAPFEASYNLSWSPAAPKKGRVVGGAPRIEQSSSRPTCAECHKPMTFVAQVSEDNALSMQDVSCGDSGSTNIFVCGHCKSPYGFPLFDTF